MSVRQRVTTVFGSFLALAVIGLTLPGLGPLLDHHFAERLHDHHHVYLGPAEENHSHPYQRHHNHGAGSAHQVHDGASGEIGFFPRRDGANQSPISFGHQVVKHQTLFDEAGENIWLFGYGPSRTIPPGEMVPPLMPPPRS